MAAAAERATRNETKQATGPALLNPYRPMQFRAHRASVHHRLTLTVPAGSRVQRLPRSTPTAHEIFANASTNISLVHSAIAAHYSTARLRPDPTAHRTRTTPNRSDAHLSPEDEAAREAEVREYFDDAAPKRHAKPSRSEHSAVYADALVPDDSHPELDKFQDLEAHTEPEQQAADAYVVVDGCFFQRLVYERSKVEEEFVETEYYKDLGGVGKQHHTVSFIKMDRDQGASFTLSEDPEAAERHASCKGNPATNEWIPARSQLILCCLGVPALVINEPYGLSVHELVDE
ncbi:hypothetical protein HU200_044555 [Digitaria exilis]|uniref:Uncharacterized protein n=1 Tax=Digitaria exilis TaxID=1010633 RepID=A0A835EF52_9POAL|nr:hypothetical protein HU200_044555 [Digitaria exilis]